MNLGITFFLSLIPCYLQKEEDEEKMCHTFTFLLAYEHTIVNDNTTRVRVKNQGRALTNTLARSCKRVQRATR